MSKLEYKILKNNIHNVKIVGYTSQSWYDNNDNIIPWVGTNENGNTYNLTPLTSSVYYNTGSLLPDGYYKWNGSTWYSITSGSSQLDYNIPLFLDSNVDEMGVMVSFADENTSGSIEQADQIVNFLYTQTGKTVQVYSSVVPSKLRTITEQVYTINWGDNTAASTLNVNSGIVGTTLPSVSHTYTGSTNYELSITLDSPWTKQKVSKIINTLNPFTGYTGLNTLGTYTYTDVTLGDYLVSGRTQNYLNNYEYTNITGNTTFSFALLGASRIGELKNYGETTVVGINTGSLDDNGDQITGYTIDGMYYMDYIDGYTVVTGSTTGFTKEEVFNNMITRNEHFLGFIDDPVVYSDIFVERGKTGVSEFNLRLGEIDNMEELEIYGNGFFTVKKT